MNPRPRLPRAFALYLALAPVLAACNVAVAPGTTGTEATPATTPEAAAAPPATTTAQPPAADALAAFLASVYGSGARVDGAWNGVPVDAAFRAKAGEAADGTVSREVCEREDATIDGKPALLLAVCGALKDFGHPTAGTTDLFVLQADGGHWRATTQAHYEDFGSMGQPGEVQAERFGANLYGFVVDSAFFNMGEGSETRTILLPHGGAFVHAAEFRKSIDNTEWAKGCKERGDCNPGRVIDLDFDMEIEDGNANAAAYPVVVEETGTQCGKHADARHTLTLDTTTFMYDVPAALTRDGCAVEAR